MPKFRLTKSVWLEKTVEAETWEQAERNAEDSETPPWIEYNEGDPTWDGNSEEEEDAG